MGADKLLGKGDMLFLVPGTSTLVRAQGTFASDDEIHKVVEYLECEPCFAPELIRILPDLVFAVLMPYLGPEAAEDEMRRVAREHAVGDSN